MSTAVAADVRTYQLYYGGEWHDAVDGGHFEVTEPYSGEPFARVPTGGAEDMEAAIAAAADAFPAWAATPPAERARLLLKAAEIVKRRRTEIADKLARETGSTILFSTFQQDLVADTLQQSAGWVYLPAGEVLQIQPAGHALDRRAPPARRGRQLHALERREHPLLARGHLTDRRRQHGRRQALGVRARSTPGC